MQLSIRNVQIVDVESAADKGFVYADSEFVAFDSHRMLGSGILRAVLTLLRRNHCSYLEMCVWYQ